MMTVPDFLREWQKITFIYCPDTNEVFFEEQGKPIDRAYFKSRHWRQFRLRKLRQTDWHCEQCGQEFQWGYDKVCIHHKHYNTLGREKLSDAVCMCSDCHNLEHGTNTEETMDLIEGLL